MVSSDTAAPSALNFTTTTSPGITRMRKNTAMATPTSVGITRRRRRITYQIIEPYTGTGRRQRQGRWRAAALLVDPHGRQILREEVAGGHVPAVDLLVVDDDALP